PPCSCRRYSSGVAAAEGGRQRNASWREMPNLGPRRTSRKPWYCLDFAEDRQMTSAFRSIHSSVWPVALAVALTSTGCSGSSSDSEQGAPESGGTTGAAGSGGSAAGSGASSGAPPGRPDGGTTP